MYKILLQWHYIEEMHAYLKVVYART
eukprot:COSAG06_NODE_40878_length_397_cov_1.214765_2_plen_26_part_01